MGRRSDDRKPWTEEDGTRFSALAQAPQFPRGSAARALGIPVRRLDGWVERGVLAPARTRSGRRRFSWSDLVKAAVLVEMQRLFGADVRPGGVAALLAGMRPFVFGIPAAAEFPIQEDGNPILAVVTHRDGRPELTIAALAAVLDAAIPPAAFVINLTALGQRLREALKHG